MQHVPKQAEVWCEAVTIPTYDVGCPDKNPMFLEKRVYQGSSGRVYPYPVIDKIYDEKKDRVYNAVFLENDYLKVMILPELGGRIQRAYDKTNDYDFVYYNEVIKPALVGLCGPWISGGIEFNWPQHHRPTTYSPVEYTLRENADGSKSVLVSETDQMYGTKGTAVFTLYPDKAYIEIQGRLYNPTDLPQTFLWWANPAVAVNDYTQSVFPPDVHAVMDHGKRDVSQFPIATGVYYKHDYGAGVDISRYKNIPVPTSYMAFHSDFDFVGGYDYQKEAGILHIADHHISPGKKQWTWGCGDFGQAWDRNLTDENGPYIELMTGMFTDNQPDFTWLMPCEEKTFTQYFMPYKKAGSVKNANTEIVLNLTYENEAAKLCVYAAAVFESASIQLLCGNEVLFEETVQLSPVAAWEASVPVHGRKPWELTLRVSDQSSRVLLEYTQAKPQINKMPEPAQAALAPCDIRTCEELYLTGLHLEQYRHATYLPEDYYLEGLQRDGGDIRLNTAYAMLMLRRGCFELAETHFRAAVKRLTWKNPNPYDSEAYLGLGVALFYQSRFDDAYDAFYKAIWSNAQQAAAFTWLALLETRKGTWHKALDFAEKALVKNSHNIRARALKGILLGKLGLDNKSWITENLLLDPFDYISRIELGEIKEADRLMAGRAPVYLRVAGEYAQAGCYDQAIQVLGLCAAKNPLIKYHEALYHHLNGDEVAMSAALKEASAANPLHCFPNRLEDIVALNLAIEKNPGDGKASYYLGNLYYDKRQYDKATALWESSAKLDGGFPTVWRNLSLAYFNKAKDAQKAKDALEKAFSLDTTDARVFLELDQLYKKLGTPPEIRFKHYEANKRLYQQRDDLMVEYITLLNLLERHEEAYEHISAHQFHPWEGGEGKITAQYTTALTELAKRALKQGDAVKGESLLRQALVLPHNLGEGKLEGAKDNNIYYWLGRCLSQAGDNANAAEMYARAAVGDEEPAGMMYYNDQPADLILYQGLANRKMNCEERGLSRFHNLVDYGKAHLFDDVRIEYFAVSLPDLQLFEDDLNRRNQVHCYYLMALGYLGLGNEAEARQYFDLTLELDPAHSGAVLHKKLCGENL